MQLYLAQVSNFVLYPDRVTIAITSMGTTHQLQFYTPGEAELWRDWVQRGLTLRRNSNASAQIHPTSAGAALTGIAGPRTQALGRLEDQPFFVGAIERPVRF